MRVDTGVQVKETRSVKSCFFFMVLAFLEYMVQLVYVSNALSASKVIST